MPPSACLGEGRSCLGEGGHAADQGGAAHQAAGAGRRSGGGPLRRADAWAALRVRIDSSTRAELIAATH